MCISLVGEYVLCVQTANTIYQHHRVEVSEQETSRTDYRWGWVRVPENKSNFSTVNASDRDPYL
jgi:hypothetical protein